MMTRNTDKDTDDSKYKWLHLPLTLNLLKSEHALNMVEVMQDIRWNKRGSKYSRTNADTEWTERDSKYGRSEKKSDKYHYLLSTYSA